MATEAQGHVYVTCPVCKGTVIVEFPGVPGAKWHGFSDGTGHFFNLIEATIIEHLPENFVVKS